MGIKDRLYFFSYYHSTANESFGGASLINALNQSLKFLWTYYLNERFKVKLSSKLGYRYLYKSVDGSSESLAAYYRLLAGLDYAIF